MNKTKSPEEILNKHSSYGDVNENPRAIVKASEALAAMKEFTEQQNELLKRAYDLVGHPCTNISSSTDMACETWRKDYERIIKE